MSDRKLLHIAERSITERYTYDPEEIKSTFGDAWDAWDGSFDDFVVDIFEEYEGSQFHGRFFENDASPDYGVELVSRWDDE